MAPCKVKVCRACLKTDTQLHYLHGKLYRAYKAISGLPLAQDILPPYLCTGCADQLMKSVSIRNRSLPVVLEILKNHGHISPPESIKAVVKPTHHDSDIELTEKKRTLSNCDLEIKHDDVPAAPGAADLGAADRGAHSNT